MRDLDLLRLSWGAIAGHRLRSILTMTGIAIGIAAVILLTSLGEGIRVFVISEFTQFGTNIIAINPGKSATTGGNPVAMVGTIRPLRIEDAEALSRLPQAQRVVPVAFGNARVEHGERGRNVLVYGVTSDMPDMWRFAVRQGQFLPPGDPHHGGMVAVLGSKLKREVFGDANVLGERIRIGGRPFRVIGVMAPKGNFLNIDLDDTVFLPVSQALSLLNREGLIEIDVSYHNAQETGDVLAAIRRVLLDRHDGEEDFTMTTQQSMLDTLGKIIGMVTAAVGAIGGISLVVGAIGILTMMWISVNESTAEIGLLRALGARRGEVLAFFLLQAALLATAGGAIGVGAGLGIIQLLHFALPALPVATPIEYVIAALLLSFAGGILCGVLPARRAAALDPIEALRAE
jgi:putative ABC transport system permease protein